MSGPGFLAKPLAPVHGESTLGRRSRGQNASEPGFLGEEDCNGLEKPRWRTLTGRQPAPVLAFRGFLGHQRSSIRRNGSYYAVGPRRVTAKRNGPDARGRVSSMVYRDSMTDLREDPAPLKRLAEKRARTLFVLTRAQSALEEQARRLDKVQLATASCREGVARLQLRDVAGTPDRTAGRRFAASTSRRRPGSHSYR